MAWNQANQQRFGRLSYISWLCLPLCKHKQNIYKKNMLQTAESRILKELDLAKFVRAKRMQMFANLIALRPR